MEETAKLTTRNKTNNTTNKNSTRYIKEKTNQELLDSINPELLQKARDKLNNMTQKARNELKKSISWFFLPDSLKKLTREKIQSKMKKIDLISLLFAFIGIICNLIASNIYIDFEEVKSNDNLISINIKPNNNNTVKILRYITSVSTIILIFSIIYHYITRLKFKIFKQKIDLSSSLWSSRLIIWLIMEILICLIHSPPFLDSVTIPIQTTGEVQTIVDVDLDLILSIIIPLRVYLLFRYYSFYSHWADDKAEKVCNDCNAIGGISFAIKAELKERPYTVVGVLLTLSILIFGYGLRNIELAFVKSVPLSSYQDWTYIWNGFWCIIITILTVGFGDYYPQTHLGRVIAVVACLWGTFLISLMVVSLTISVEFTPQEEKAYEELKNAEASFKLRKKAAKIIRLGHQLKISNENLNNSNLKYSKLEYLKIYNEFKSMIDEFRILRKNIITKEHEVSAETILHKLNHNVTEQMEKMIADTNLYITSLTEHIKLSKELQEKIGESSDRLDSLVKGMHKCIID